MHGYLNFILDSVIFIDLSYMPLFYHILFIYIFKMKWKPYRINFLIPSLLLNMWVTLIGYKHEHVGHYKY